MIHITVLYYNSNNCIIGVVLLYIINLQDYIKVLSEHEEIPEKNNHALFNNVLIMFNNYMLE